MHSNPHRFSVPARWAAAAALLLAVAVTASPAHAGPDRSIDPATLTPAPPDFFNSQCRTAGQQILCDLAFVDPVSPVLEPTDLTCGSGADQFVLLDTWTRSVRGTRYYSADGLLLRRHFSDRWQGSLTNSQTGASVGYDQRNTYLHDLAVPGDPGTGVERDTVHTRVDTGAGALVLDSGLLVRSVDDDTLVRRTGHHLIDDWFEGDPTALDQLCAALS